MAFGGDAVAGPAQLRDIARRLVAERERGKDVVAVVQAMDRTTAELVELAHAVSPRPEPRELDMLVSVGERIACALCAMAVIDLGHPAVSLTGSQAGIVTDCVHGQARIVEIRARRIEEALAAGVIVLVAGQQGVSTDHEVTMLGAAGPAITAVALATALGAESCDTFAAAEPLSLPSMQSAQDNGAVPHHGTAA
jgi:aspartate kinase